MENPCDKFAVAAVNSDNKTISQCNSYSLNGVFNSIKNSSKLSIDDESSNQINRSNTNNNKCGRKRNINMWEKKDAGDGDDNDEDNENENEKKSKWFGLNAHSNKNNNNNNKNNNDKSDQNGTIKRIKLDTAHVNDIQNHERKDKMYQVSTY